MWVFVSRYFDEYSSAQLDSGGRVGIYLSTSGSRSFACGRPFSCARRIELSTRIYVLKQLFVLISIPNLLYASYNWRVHLLASFCSTSNLVLAYSSYARELPGGSPKPYTDLFPSSRLLGSRILSLLLLFSRRITYRFR